MAACARACTRYVNRRSRKTYTQLVLRGEDSVATEKGRCAAANKRRRQVGWWRDASRARDGSMDGMCVCVRVRVRVRVCACVAGGSWGVCCALRELSLSVISTISMRVMRDVKRDAHPTFGESNPDQRDRLKGHRAANRRR
mmetsp:Transcript_30866/g.69708  ORF Transcript_30866/g.69708 Transcript_30866/m.69708 type:complete len:141 (-) Transcript_30866:440-862(-)